MQVELLQFKLQKVWTLVDLPNGKRAISTKWVYRNKKDERGIVIKNKARLVAQGYTQEEGIKYDEVFAHVARIEAIRLLLAHASFKDFVVYWIDVKSVTPRQGGNARHKKEWISSQHMTMERFGKITEKGTIKTDFKLTDESHVLLKVPRKNNMSSVDLKNIVPKGDDLNMPELEDIVYSDDDEDVGAEDDMNNLDAFITVSPIPTTRIYKDHPVEQIIGDLNSAPQTRRMTKNMMDGKNVFLYGKIKKEVYVCQPPGFEDPNFPDRVYKVEKALYVLHQAPRVWTASKVEEGWDFYQSRQCVLVAIDTKSKPKDVTSHAAKTVNGEVQLQALVDGKKIIVTEASIRSDLQLNDEEGMDCLPNATIFEELTRMGVGKGFSRRETPLFPIMVVQNQADMGEGSSAITHYPHITRRPHYQPSISQPQRKQRPRKPKRKDTEIPQPSGPTTNVADEAVYKERDNNLERVATTAIGLDVEQDRGRYGDDIMFDVSDLAGEEVFVAKQGVSDKDVNLSVNEVTLAQALAALKSAKVQEKANVVGKPRESIITTPTLTTTTVATIITATSTRPKAKGLLFMKRSKQRTPAIKLSKKIALKLYEEVAQRLQAEFDEQERIVREKVEANIALKETWDDIQAKIEADKLLAERLQA
ncbi:putative ribonuclease H-like domain-containing protein [Tanacetum coccineum]